METRGYFAVPGTASFVVVSVHGTRFKGFTTFEKAERFAWSMGDGKPGTVGGPLVVEVTPYATSEVF